MQNETKREGYVKIVFIGDVVGKPGRRAFELGYEEIKRKYSPDFVIVNVENAAGGNGVTPQIVDYFLSKGVDCLTSGNHVWDKREFLKYVDMYDRFLRPFNFPSGTPGKGFCVIEKKGKKIAVVNLIGRLLMDYFFECPFRKLEEILGYIGDVKHIIVDFHAEATSEKRAFGFWADGKVSAVIGTHTHIQTADEMIMEKGTAYITDVGMTGYLYSVIGLDIESALNKLLYRLPFKVEPGGKILGINGVFIEFDKNGKAVFIERFKKIID